MSTETFTNRDLQHALSIGISPDVVARQYLRQEAAEKRAVKLELKAAKNEVTAIYFPRATMTRTQRAVRWIKKVVR